MSLVMPAAGTEGQEKMTGIAWLALISAWLGLCLDVMDWQFLSMAAPAITKEFGYSSTLMGVLLGAALIGAGIGGFFSGWLADKIGRVKAVSIMILWYSFFTCIFPLGAGNFALMLILRILAGIGLGGEWGVGNTMVAEIVPRRYRILASSFIQTGFAVGPLLAAVLSAAIIPNYGWRWLFYIGVAPALLALVIRLGIPEPPAWRELQEKARKGQEVGLGQLGRLLSEDYRRRTLLCFFMVLCTIMAYWASMSWIPSWLATARGMTIVKSAGYLVAMNLGGIVAFILFGLIADRWGRKPPAYLALVGSTIIVPIFVSINNPTLLLWMSPVYAFITYPVFGLYGGYLSELFPTEIRGLAVGGIYNFGRFFSFFGPYLLGWITSISSMTTAIGLTSILYALSIIPLAMLPETIVKRPRTTSANMGAS